MACGSDTALFGMEEIGRTERGEGRPTRLRLRHRFGLRAGEGDLRLSGGPDDHGAVSSRGLTIGVATEGDWVLAYQWVGQPAAAPP